MLYLLVLDQTKNESKFTHITYIERQCRLKKLLPCLVKIIYNVYYMNRIRTLQSISVFIKRVLLLSDIVFIIRFLFLTTQEKITTN